MQGGAAASVRLASEHVAQPHVEGYCPLLAKLCFHGVRSRLADDHRQKPSDRSCKKTHHICFVECCLYLRPQPVLVERSFLVSNGAKEVHFLSYLPGCGWPETPRVAAAGTKVCEAPPPHFRTGTSRHVSAPPETQRTRCMSA